MRQSGCDDIERVISKIPRLNMAPRNTPITKLDHLSEQFGANIYCKRDDLNLFGFGGNKIRKLDFLIADALKNGCDCIVTDGSSQSNWCRMTAAACSYFGLESHLVLGGSPPARRTGNLRLIDILGANVYFSGDDSDETVALLKASLMAELRAKGRNPLEIIVGGSTPLGALGYVDAMAEVLAFENAAEISFDAIIVATGSGGTQAGLVAGQAISGWTGDIIGITVSRPASQQSEKISRIVAATGDLLGVDLTQGRVITNDAYMGGGYRVRSQAADEAVIAFASKEGLFLDDVYTGKAASGLIDMVLKGQFARDDNILFFHTGGSPQLFE